MRDIVPVGLEELLETGRQPFLLLAIAFVEKVVDERKR